VYFRHDSPISKKQQIQTPQTIGNTPKKPHQGRNAQSSSAVKQKQDSVHLGNHNDTQSATYQHPRFNKND